MIFDMHLSFRAACLLGLFLLIAGCSNIKTFPSTADKNLQVRTKVSGAVTTLQVHSMKGGCVVDYLGTVDLKNGETLVGVTPDQPVDLIFLFTTYRFGGGGGMLPYTTVFTPRLGVHYVADVSYADRIYNVSIHEIGSRGVLGREIERRAVDCPENK
jgi:hypothetical protein